MIFIPLIQRSDAAHAGVLPLRQTTRQRGAARGDATLCAMCFQIIFINEIQPVFITDIIPGWMIGVVGGTHSVDMIRFHHQGVRDHFLPCERSPASAGELVPVNAFEH